MKKCKSCIYEERKQEGGCGFCRYYMDQPRLQSHFIRKVKFRPRLKEGKRTGMITKRYSKSHSFGSNRKRIPILIKREVLARDKGKCKICKNGFEIEIHHVNLIPSDNRPENLAVLCKAHQGRAHTKKYYKIYQRILTRLIKEDNEAKGTN